MEVTEAINEYAQKKISHAIEPYKAVLKHVEGRMSVRGGDAGKGSRQQKIEITVTTARHGIVRAEQVEADLYAAIDFACDKLTRSLRKLKEKSVKKGKWPGRGFEKGATSISDVLPEEDVDLDLAPSDDDVEEATAKLDLPSSVKRTKVFYLDEMSTQDAIDKLQIVDHDFYIYLDENSGHVQVVYKRNEDNSHGVIITIPDNTQLMPR